MERETLSPTMQSVLDELGPDSLVSTRAIIAAILKRHPEYGNKRAPDIEVAWPDPAETRSTSAWLEEIRALYKQDVFQTLHGRAVILGLALLDLASGGQMVAAGLFFATASELTPNLVESLNALGHERLRRIPLALIAAGSLERDVIHHQPEIRTAALSRDGRRALSASENEIALWNLASGARQRRITTPSPIAAVTFCRGDTQIAAISQTGEAYLWPISEDTSPNIIPNTADRLSSRPVISADGSRAVYTGGDVGGVFYNLDLLAGEVSSDTTVARMEDASLVSASISPEGDAALGYAVFGSLYDYPVQGGSASLVDTNMTFPSGEIEIALGPNGFLAVMEFPSRVTLLARDEGSTGSVSYQVRWENSLSPTKGNPGILAISPNGNFLTVPGPEGVELWSIVTGNRVAFLPDNGVTAFSADSQRLAIARRDGTIGVWNIGLKPLKVPAPVAGFLTDRPEGPDLLDIDTDVDAFASLIAAKSVEPPLSIGLFGDWGSGKTFFMRRLRDRVAEITELARDSGAMQKEIALYKYVAQVEFNAWHYSSGELWAGLVEHLFTKLELYPKEPENAVEARRRPLLQQLGFKEEELSEAAQEVGDTKIDLDNAKTELEDLEKDHTKQLKELEEVQSRDLWQAAGIESELLENAKVALRAAGYSELLESGQALADALNETREALTFGNPVVNALTRAEDRQRRFRQLLGVAIGAPLLGLLIGLIIRQFADSGLAALLGSSTGLVGLITMSAQWLRSQAEWAAARRERVEEAWKALNEPYEKEVVRQQKERAEKEREISEINAKLNETLSRRETLTRQVDQLQEEVKATTAGNLLSRLISDRADSEDYRKHLGLLTLVRRDFEKISDYLMLGNRAAETYVDLVAENEGATSRINRIVLYIDDLDRCEPGTVVKVLQAVHLLLAFPLFAVVVGVDSRWVSESLIDQYPELLGPGEPASPHDYLEKIFQIPFWLQPLSGSSSARMLRGLTREDRLASAATTLASSQPPTPDTQDGKGREPEDKDTGKEPREKSELAGAASEAVVRSADLNPQGLQITPPEQEFMVALASLLTRSPRAIKRFVNIYRLIKVRSATPLSFLRERGPESPYKIVMLLLAIITGLPGISTYFFDLLCKGSARPKTLEDLVAHLEHKAGPQRAADIDTPVAGGTNGVANAEPPEPSGTNGAAASGTPPPADGDTDPFSTREGLAALDPDQVGQLRAWLFDPEHPDRGDWKILETARLAEWAESVARYSFRVRV